MIGTTYRRHISLRHDRYQSSTSDQHHATYLIDKSFPPPNHVMPHHHIATYPFNTSRYTRHARHLVTDSDHVLARYRIHTHLREDRSHSVIHSWTRHCIPSSVRLVAPSIRHVAPPDLPVTPPDLPVASPRAQNTSTTSLYKPCHTSDS
jgi:hypothetical protein